MKRRDAMRRWVFRIRARGRTSIIRRRGRAVRNLSSVSSEPPIRRDVREVRQSAQSQGSPDSARSARRPTDAGAGRKGDL